MGGIEGGGIDGGGVLMGGLLAASTHTVHQTLTQGSYNTQGSVNT